MTFKSFILEKITSNSVVISIDIQPCYEKACNHILNNYIHFINNFKGKLISFYNNEDIGCDSEQNVINWLYEIGVEEYVIDNTIWKPKQYAFFRNWMDQQLPLNEIIKAIRFMVTNNINDSREITLPQWKSIYGNQWETVKDIVLSDMINLPDISIPELKSYQHIYVCGGAKHECLSEFLLLLNAFNIKYTLINSLIYGGDYSSKKYIT